jgi:hypothetical protein
MIDTGAELTEEMLEDISSRIERAVNKTMN